MRLEQQENTIRKKKNEKHKNKISSSEQERHFSFFHIFILCQSNEDGTNVRFENAVNSLNDRRIG